MDDVLVPISRMNRGRYVGRRCVVPQEAPARRSQGDRGSRGSGVCLSHWGGKTKPKSDPGVRPNPGCASNSLQVGVFQTRSPGAAFCGPHCCYRHTSAIRKNVASSASNGTRKATTVSCCSTKASKFFIDPMIASSLEAHAYRSESPRMRVWRRCNSTSLFGVHCNGRRS
jgi:hypothetical protein